MKRQLIAAGPNDVEGGDIVEQSEGEPESLQRQRKKAEKVVSVRLAAEDLARAQALSLVDETTLGEQIRRAVSEYLASRSHDPGLKAAIDATRKRQAALLSALEEAG